MDSLIRIKLEVGGRVVGFCRAHPSDNAGLNAAVAKLENRLARADVLDDHHSRGETAVKVSVVNKHDLRITIRDGIMLLAGLAEAAEVEQPDLSVRIRVPGAKISLTEFVSVARAAVRQAMDVEPLLKTYGLPDTLLAELMAALDRVESTEEAKDAGRNAQVGATADLDKVASEVCRILRQLDRLQNHAFKNDAELLAAWKRARNMPIPVRAKPEAKAPTHTA